VDEFPVQGRGGQGVIAIQTSDRNGRMVGAIQARQEDEIMLISSGGDAGAHACG
jgi:DNA gyrase subunit A